MIADQYLWVSVEGTDAVGKSSLLQELKKQLEADSNAFVTVFLNEFSDSPVGDVIRNIIRGHRFFRIGSVQHPMTETITLYADYLYQFESAFQKYSEQRILFISDRGPYSFLTYQQIRIAKSYPRLSALETETWINALFTPIGFPHVNLLLVSPVEQILQRLTNREGAPNDEELRFIEHVQEAYLEIFARQQRVGKADMFVLNSLDGNFDEIVTQSMCAIQKAITDASWTT